MQIINADGRPGVIDDGEVVWLDALVPAGVASAAAFLWVFANWPELMPRLGRADLERAALDDVSLGPPVPRPGKVIGAPVNYLDHQREMNAEHTIAGLGVFLKAPTSVIGPGDTILLPFADRRTDQEAELGVVIGRGGRDIDAATSLQHVLGYTCVIDVTVRGNEDRSTRKSFDTFTPVGGWITTADEVVDPSGLQLRGWVNDELRQDASTADMIYGVPELIAYASSVMTLEPGDIITTGTPAGVGPISPGDSVRVEVENVAVLNVDVDARG